MLIDRESEVLRLESALVDCASNRARTIVIEGPAGCGKTELLEFVAARALESDAVVLKATGIPSESNESLGVLRQLLLLGAGLPAEVEQELHRLLEEEEAAAACGLDGGPASGGLLGPGGSLAPGGFLGTGGSATCGRAVRMRRFCAALHTVARDRLVVICVDDLQHLDNESLEYLLHIAGNSRSTRLLLAFGDVLYYRQQDAGYRTEFLRQPNFERIRVDCLDRSGTAQLLAHLQPDTPVCEELLDYAYGLTGGNPLLVRALHEEGPIADLLAEQKDSVDPLVGESFAHVVLICLERSGPMAGKVADGLAVLDDLAAHDLLTELCELPHAVATKAMRALRAARVIVDSRFRHPAVRRGVLDGMAPEHRRHLHHRAAELLHRQGATAATAAAHLLAAGHSDEEWAVTVLRDAAEEVLADDVDDLAVDFLDLAYRLCGDPVQRIEIRVRTAVILRRNHPSAAEKVAEGLLRAIHAGEVPTRQLMPIVDLFLVHRRVEEAFEVMTKARALAYEAARAGGAEGAAVDTRVGSDSALAQLVEARYPWAEGGVLGPPKVGGGGSSVVLTPNEERSVLDQPWSLSLGLNRDDYVIAAEELLRHTVLTDATLEPIASAIKCLLFSGNTQKAGFWSESFLESAERHGADGWSALFAGLRAEVAFAQGNPGCAQKYTQAGIARIVEGTESVLVSGLIALQVMAQIALGDIEGSARRLNQPVPSAVYGSAYGLVYRRARGHHHLAINRLDAALEDFVAVGEQARRWGADQPAWLPWRGDVAEVLLRLGERKEAERLVTEQITRVGGNNLRTRGISHRILGAAVGSDERLPLLTRAVAQLRLAGDRLELARAMCDLGDAHKQLGDGDQAAMAARRAWELATECGAQPLRARIDQEHDVNSWGTTVWNAPVDIRDAKLSDSEKKVAALAARGYTNRDISSRLYVTVSTVEQHLTRAYRKLNIGGRQQLPIDLQFEVDEVA
nr:LuxR family transcriptional regulator [Streptomyces kanamyceticus]